MAIVTQLYEAAQEIVSDAGSRADVHYLVEDAADETAALAAADLAIPAWRGTLERTHLSLDERLSDTHWRVVAHYNQPDFDQEHPEPIRTFDTSGGSQHITQSLATRGRYGDNPPDFQGAIGFDGERIAGVDITVPVFQFQETFYRKDSDVDEAYLGTLFRTTGKVNSDTWLGFQPGEALFLGATGARRSASDYWEITCKFAAQPNQTNLTIGPLTVVEKRGWDYLWIRYAPAVDEAAHAVVQRPVAAYVEQVYESTAFASLGISDAW